LGYPHDYEILHLLPIKNGDLWPIWPSPTSALCPGTVPSSPAGAGARKVGGAEGGGGSVQESEDLATAG